MTRQMVHVQLLLGKRVFAQNGKPIGRLEDIRTEMDRGHFFVSEFLVGSYAAFFAPSFVSSRLCVKLLFLTFALSGCATKPSGPFAYVTNERDGTISVIDTKTDQVVSTIKVGGRLRGIRLSADRSKIWVAI